MGPYYYKVNRIDGDYAYLIRTDISDSEEMIVARALLPEDIDINTKLKWRILFIQFLISRIKEFLALKIRLCSDL